MNRDQAETLALQALSHIAGDEQSLTRFLSESGIDPALLRQHADDPAVLAGALDYLLQDEPLLIAFCAAQGIAPTAPARARLLLPGGDQPWQ